MGCRKILESGIRSIERRESWGKAEGRMQGTQGGWGLG